MIADTDGTSGASGFAYNPLSPTAVEPLVDYTTIYSEEHIEKPVKKKKKYYQKFTDVNFKTRDHK